MTSILAGQPILIVEDEFIIALDLASSFQAAETRAVIASSLSQAMALIDRHSWAGAVVDYRLNREDCAPLCERLLQREIPFVIYSGLPEFSVPSGGVYIPKPANPDDIVRVVEEIAAHPHQAA
jgi:ActR/RegA family two-component response regulator